MATPLQLPVEPEEDELLELEDELLELEDELLELEEDELLELERRRTA